MVVLGQPAVSPWDYSCDWFSVGAKLIRLYKFFGLNVTLLFGEGDLSEGRKANGQDDEDREMHQQAADAHKRFTDPKCHAEIES